MRRPLLLFAVVFFWGLAATSAQAQPGGQQARELRAQLEALQLQLDALTRHDSTASHKVTEIGSAFGRQRDFDQPRLVVRIYDLSDLYAIAPPYAAREPGDLEDTERAVFPEVMAAAASRAGMGGGGFGGGGFGGMGGFFAVPNSSARLKDRASQTLAQASGGGGEVDAGRTTVDGLIETITTTISPEEWTDVGGPASIKALGASLVISAPVNMHEQIGALLDLFRKRWGSLRTVSVQAHWLWLTEAQLAAALAEPPPGPADQPRAFGALSDAAWIKLREPAAGDAPRRANYHAVLTCYNGQTVNALAGRQRLIVGGMTPVVGGQEQGTAYHPNVRALHEGAALQITPVVTRTAKYVVVDVHSRVNILAPAERAAAGADAPPPGDVQQVVAAIDRLALQSQRLSTTLRIPVGQPTLVGGMTFDAQPAGGPNLYLFVTAVVQELRDEEGTEVKADAPAAPAPATPPENPAAKE
jgi:hypothetical protein